MVMLSSVPSQTLSANAVSIAAHRTDHTEISHTPRVARPAKLVHAPPRLKAVASELIDNTSGRFNAELKLDATTTNTLDWACIRNAESHDNFHQETGAYGITITSWQWLGYHGTPGQSSVRFQDGVALRIFRMNGDHFLGSWNDVCTLGEGLP